MFKTLELFVRWMSIRPVAGNTTRRMSFSEYRQRCTSLEKARRVQFCLRQDTACKPTIKRKGERRRFMTPLEIAARQENIKKAQTALRVKRALEAIPVAGAAE